MSTALPSTFGQLLTPSFLATYVARMLLHGEFVALVDVDEGGELGLIPECSV